MLLPYQIVHLGSICKPQYNLKNHPVLLGGFLKDDFIQLRLLQPQILHQAQVLLPQHPQ